MRQALAEGLLDPRLPAGGVLGLQVRVAHEVGGGGVAEQLEHARVLHARAAGGVQARALVEPVAGVRVEGVVVAEHAVAVVADRAADRQPAVHHQVVLADQPVGVDGVAAGVGEAERVDGLELVALAVHRAGQRLAEPLGAELQRRDVGGAVAAALVAELQLAAVFVVLPLRVRDLRVERVAPAAAQPLVLQPDQAVGGAVAVEGVAVDRLARDGVVLVVGVGAGVVEAADRADAEIGGEAVGQPRRELVDVGAHVARAAGRHHGPVGVIDVAAQREVQPVLHARHPAAEFAGPEGAAFQPRLHAGPVGARGGDVVHHPSDGVRAVERALLAAQHLHLGDLVGQEAREVEGVLIGVADLDAVDQHQRVVRLRPADADVGEAADRAVAVHLHAGNVAQHVGDHLRLARGELLRVDHRDGGAEQLAVNALVVAGGGDDHLRGRGGVADRRGGLGVGQAGRQQEGGEERRAGGGGNQVTGDRFRAASAGAVANSENAAARRSATASASSAIASNITAKLS